MLPDFGWSELLVIAIVLIVIVGPKDLPNMLRTFAKTTGSLRKMAGDFRRQFDEALKEAELDDVRDLANEMKGLDPRGQIKEALNPLGKVGEDLSEDLKRAAKDIDKASKPPSAADSALAASGDKMKAAQEKAAKPAAKSTTAKASTAKSKTAAAKSKAPAKRAATSKAAAKPAAAKAATKSAAAKTFRIEIHGKTGREKAGCRDRETEKRAEIQARGEIRGREDEQSQVLRG
jgi:sec-independent protein translocase protein TatB